MEKAVDEELGARLESKSRRVQQLTDVLRMLDRLNGHRCVKEGRACWRHFGGRRVDEEGIVLDGDGEVGDRTLLGLGANELDLLRRVGEAEEFEVRKASCV